MTKMTVITGEERRRRWSDDERTRILAACAAPGAVVAEVGRRWDVATSLIYKWRRAAQDAACNRGFVPVVIADKAPDDVKDTVNTRDRAFASIIVEIGGARINIGADAPTALVAAMLKVLRS